MLATGAKLTYMWQMDRPVRERWKLGLKTTLWDAKVGNNYSFLKPPAGIREFALLWGMINFKFKCTKYLCSTKNLPARVFQCLPS